MATDHGTTRGYASGCRCKRCRAAYAAYMREYRHRTGRQKPSREEAYLAREMDEARLELAEDLQDDVAVTVSLTPLAYRILLALQLRRKQRRHSLIDTLLREQGSDAVSAAA